jgi:hypothetical protein
LRAVGLFADAGMAAALLRSILVLTITFMQSTQGWDAGQRRRQAVLSQAKVALR